MVDFLIGSVFNVLVILLERNPIKYKEGLNWSRYAVTIVVCNTVFILPFILKALSYNEKIPVDFFFKGIFLVFSIPAILLIIQLFSFIFIIRSVIKPDYEIKPAVLHPSVVSYFKLSEREREIAAMLMDGKSYKSISSALFISAGTVRTHVINIYRKAGVKRRLDFIRACRNVTE